MKYIYGVFDNVSEEFVSTFIANNDRQAKIILKMNLQKNSNDDTDVSLLRVSTLDYEKSQLVATMDDFIEVPDGSGDTKQ